MRPNRTAQQLQGWLQALARIGAAVNKDVPLSDLLNMIAKTACELMAYDFCAITLPDAGEQVLLIKGSYGLSDDYIRDVNATHPIRLHGIPVPAPSSQAFSLGVAVQVADTATNPSFGPWGGVARDQGFTSMIAVPLNASNETLGTLNCYTRSPHEFTKEEESLLTMLADEAAIVITTSRLRSQQARTISDLNELNDSLEMQYELQRQGAEVHERLTAIALEGGGVPSVAGALAELLSRPVSVRGANGALLHTAEFDADRLPNVLTGEASDQNRELLSRKSTVPGLSEVEVPSDDGGSTRAICAPVVIKDELVAWIWTTGSLSQLTPLDRRTIEHAATVLALELLRARTAAEAAWRHSGEILTGLLSGAGRGAGALVAHAASLGHDLTQTHAVIVTRYDTRNDGPLQYRLAATFMRLTEETQPKPLLGMHEGYVVALWPLGQAPLESARTVSEDIRRSLADGVRSSGPANSAIAGPVNDPAHYPEAFTIARGAVELAGASGISRRTLLLSDLGMSGLFLQLPDLTKLRRYSDEVLGPLREYDAAQGTSLLETLSVLIRNDLNVRATAEQMFVHKNTVVQRRRRIEELLGLELTNIVALTHIATALKLEEVIEARQA